MQKWHPQYHGSSSRHRGYPGRGRTHAQQPSARDQIRELPEYQSFESVLLDVGVSEAVIHQGSKQITGAFPEKAKANLRKAEGFFGFLFEDPKIRQPADELYPAVVPLIADAIQEGGDVHYGFWALSQGLRDCANPLAVCKSLSSLMDYRQAMTLATCLWSQEKSTPETVRDALEVLSDPLAHELIEHYWTKKPLWESFLLFTAKYPEDTRVRLAYEAGIRQGVHAPPAAYARKLMDVGEQISLSIHYGVGIIAVGPAEEGHEGIEKRIGVPDGMRRRIVPGSIIQPAEDSPYELVLPSVSASNLGGERPPLSFHGDPLYLIARHMLDQGFPDFTLRYQGDARYLSETIPLSQANLAEPSAVPQESILREVSTPVDLPKMGYLRVRGDTLSAMYLLSADDERKHISEGDAFCKFRWDATQSLLRLGWTRFKHVIDADPQAVYRHIRGLGDPWERVQVLIEPGRK